MNANPAMHALVSREEWLAARRLLLAREKELTAQRDLVSAERRRLPWVAVDKAYVFDGANGPESLADMFEGRSQLIVYHFMFGPGWEEGCPSCSFLADHIDGALPHLAARGVTLAAVSRAPLAKLAAFRQRMDWRFKWVSSSGSDFNYDYHVSFTQEELAGGKVAYNYRMEEAAGMEDLHGISVFARDGQGNVFHTYSSYARGADPLVGTYHYMDLTPKGRDEDGLPFPMAWVRHHDKYGVPEPVAPAAACCHAEAGAA